MAQARCSRVGGAGPSAAGAPPLRGVFGDRAHPVGQVAAGVLDDPILGVLACALRQEDEGDTPWPRSEERR